MADVSGLKRKRKKSANKPVSADPPCGSSQPPLQSSSLLLEVPADTNTSMPVWDAIRSQQAAVTWTVSPYSVSVHFTPQTRKKKKPSTSAMSCSVLIQHDVVPHNTSCVLRNFLQNTQTLCSACQKCPPTSNPAASRMSSPQPVHQPATNTSKKHPVSLPSKLQAQSEAPSALSFSTKSLDNVLICDDFLLGSCQNGARCSMHHTAYPFHWQLLSVSTQQWMDLPPRSQVLLERIYCDADNDYVELKDGETYVSLHLSMMELMDEFSKYKNIRRLTNSECTKKNPHFPSKWKLYWCDSYHFKEYTTDLTTLLIQKMKEKMTTYNFHIGTKKYKVDFTSMTQTNVATGNRRDIRCRPVYRSLQSLQPYLRTGVLSNLTPHDPGVSGTNFNLDPLLDFSSWYPPVWSLASVQDYSRVDVPLGTLVYQRVSALVYESLPESEIDIVSIQQIQNLFQWDKYQRQKVHMQKLHAGSLEPLERHLFHGTTASAAESICCNNFDPRLAGVNGNSHGYGSYFATKAWTSDVFTGELYSEEDSYMFLAKVLVGRVVVGKQHYRRPPPRSFKRQPHTLYDACIDNKDTPTMFIVYDSCQCYPYYLIKYRTLPTEIPISE